MRIPVLEGTIKRRILVNYVADPDVVQAILPSRFRPKLYRGKAVVGICLIALQQIRPKGLPAIFGFSSENAAHRIAVEWDESGIVKEGVYVPRRDTGSAVNALAGGCLFPGEHHKASFRTNEDAIQMKLEMASYDGSVSLAVTGEVADSLPTDSVFADVEKASDFFRCGSLGYSATGNAERLDGVILKTKDWKVRPLQVKSVASSYFEDGERFPPGSIRFDHALIMRNVEHEWHSAEDLLLNDQISLQGLRRDNLSHLPRGLY